MKKIILSIALVAFTTAIMAQDVTIKKGKVTMSEKDYNELKEMAKSYEITSQKVTTMQRRLRQLEENYITEVGTFQDSVSYAIGCDMYNNLERQKLDLNYKAVAKALMDCANNKQEMTPQTISIMIQRFNKEFERKQQEKIQKTTAEGKEFLKRNSNNKSVYTTASGLQYKKISDGNGKHPKASDKVKVHYTGRLIDGTIFDSSVQRGTPIEFGLNQVIKGWTEGLQLMDEGSKYMLFIPAELGYGNQDMGNIPAGSTLIFEVELLEIVK